VIGRWNTRPERADRKKNGRIPLPSAIPARQSARPSIVRYFALELERLRELAADGLVTVEPDRLSVTARGRFLLRIIEMCFDAHLKQAQAPEMRYSKAL
jgi:coproporphyrinogen III oxidase-like Fe-S oxidoreductase